MASPSRTFYDESHPRLWRVARAMVEPATVTGSNSATGVVRPYDPPEDTEFLAKRSAFPLVGT